MEKLNGSPANRSKKHDIYNSAYNTASQNTTLQYPLPLRFLLMTPFYSSYIMLMI